MFFKLMLLKVFVILVIVLMNFLVVWCFILMLIVFKFVKCLNNSVLFFIMGFDVRGFKLFNFKMVVLLLMIVIILFLVVYL